MDSYPLVDSEIKAIVEHMKTAKWAFHEKAYREFLRRLKGIVWEEESKLDGIREAES